MTATATAPWVRAPRPLSRSRWHLVIRPEEYGQVEFDGRPRRPWCAAAPAPPDWVRETRTFTTSQQARERTGLPACATCLRKFTRWLRVKETEARALHAGYHLVTPGVYGDGYTVVAPDGAVVATGAPGAGEAIRRAREHAAEPTGGGRACPAIECRTGS